jgi:hypothetical protein
VTRLRGVALFVIAGVLGLAPTAAGSYGLASGPSSATLRVDESGSAGITWRAGGQTSSFVVPTSGQGYHGTVAADVSKPVSLALPMAIAVRRAPNGTLYALQLVKVGSRPASLDLSRWKGPPTAITLAIAGDHLIGTVTFAGKPVSGSSPTLAGRSSRVYVDIECLGCPGATTTWQLIVGVPPKPDGTFRVYLRQSWVGSKYRATVQGPNIGGQLAPDARTVIMAAG